MTSSISPIPTSTNLRVEAWVVDTGRMPEVASSGSTLERNAWMTQKITAPITGPKIVAAPPSSSEVQMKKVSEVT